MTVPDLIEQYEIPKEYHEALWTAYQEGVKRGYIDGAIKVFNVPTVSAPQPDIVEEDV